MSSNVLPQDQKSWTETPPAYPPVRYYIAEIVESQTWLDKLAAPFQSWLANLFGKQGEPKYVIKDVLNGTWLGHPLHPVLVAVPLGAWSVTTVFDLMTLSSEDTNLERGADLSLLIGLSGALGSAVT